MFLGIVTDKTIHHAADTYSKSSRDDHVYTVMTSLDKKNDIAVVTMIKPAKPSPYGDSDHGAHVGIVMETSIGRVSDQQQQQQQSNVKVMAKAAAKRSTFSSTKNDVLCGTCYYYAWIAFLFSFVVMAPLGVLLIIFVRQWRQAVAQGNRGRAVAKQHNADLLIKVSIIVCATLLLLLTGVLIFAYQARTGSGSADDALAKDGKVTLATTPPQPDWRLIGQEPSHGPVLAEHSPIGQLSRVDQGMIKHILFGANDEDKAAALRSRLMQQASRPDDEETSAEMLSDVTDEETGTNSSASLNGIEMASQQTALLGEDALPQKLPSSSSAAVPPVSASQPSPAAAAGSEGSILAAHRPSSSGLKLMESLDASPDRSLLTASLRTGNGRGSSSSFVARATKKNPERDVDVDKPIHHDAEDDFYIEGEGSDQGSFDSSNEEYVLYKLEDDEFATLP